MSRPNADQYDRALAKLFGADGHERLGRATYVRLEGDGVWRGLVTTFHVRHPRLCVQPILAIFCPKAAKIVRRGLVEIYGPTAQTRASRLGDLIEAQPLYDSASKIAGTDRTPYSYDVKITDEVDKSAKLAHEDYRRVERRFFGDLSSLANLRDRIVQHPAGTGAALYAIAVSYLLNPRLSAKEVDALATLVTNEMTRDFSAYFKGKFCIGS